MLITFSEKIQDGSKWSECVVLGVAFLLFYHTTALGWFWYQTPALRWFRCQICGFKWRQNCSLKIWHTPASLQNANPPPSSSPGCHHRHPGCLHSALRVRTSAWKIPCASYLFNPRNPQWQSCKTFYHLIFLLILFKPFQYKKPTVAIL